MNLCKNNTTPEIIINAANAKTTIPLETLQEAFGGPSYALLACDIDGSKGSLNSVGICFGERLLLSFACVLIEICTGVDDYGNPTEQVECPENSLTDTYVNSCAISKISDITIPNWSDVNKL